MPPPNGLIMGLLGSAFLLPPASCTCRVFTTKMPPFSVYMRECRKARLRYRCLISPSRPVCGPSITFTMSLRRIWFWSQSSAMVFRFSRRFCNAVGLHSITLPCMPRTWKFSRSSRTITPTVCASSCTRSPHW
uniref:Putative secreted protein n=1 Tax=Anopheles triannulatus TaxID=58253 RepID=A0A2M4B381_9DIPT